MKSEQGKVWSNAPPDEYMQLYASHLMEPLSVIPLKTVSKTKSREVTAQNDPRESIPLNLIEIPFKTDDSSRAKLHEHTNLFQNAIKM